MTKTAKEYPVEALAFRPSWQIGVPANGLYVHREDDASSQFLADMAERIAALCVQSQRPDSGIADRAVPLLRESDARSNYCHLEPVSCDVPVDESFGVMLYTSDGNMRPLDAIEADVIRLAICHYRGCMSEVARRLNIGRSTLYRKLGELGIDHTGYRAE